MKIYDIKQGTPEWYDLRRHIPTCSQFGRIITPITGKYAAAAEGYMAELLAYDAGWEGNGFQGSPDTERGHRVEPLALRWVEMKLKTEVRKVGFCMSDCGTYGGSPDALLEDDTPVEVKAPDLHTYVKWAMDCEWYKGGTAIPNEHKAQVHAEMYVTGASRAIFVAYADNARLRNMMIEVKRDEFTDKLGECLAMFNERLEAMRSAILIDAEPVTIKQRPPTMTEVLNQLHRETL